MYTAHDFNSLFLGTVPSFTATSSPELDALLSSFRNNVFLPSHLNAEQQNLIYSAKRKKLLIEEPVRVDLGGEIFRLQHVDRTKDVPSLTKGIIQAASLMKTQEDWLNIFPLLAGYRKCPKKLTLEQKDRLVRKAGKAGRIRVLVEAAKRVDYTGFTLKDPHLVSEMAWYAQHDSASRQWQKNARALSCVEEIAFLLEDQRHAGGFEIKIQDPRARPELIGILLQLSAVETIKGREEGRDTEAEKINVERVKKYAERLRAVIEQGHEVSLSLTLSGTTSKYGEDHIFLYRMAPIVHGMKLAERILERRSSLANWIQAQRKIYGDAAQEAYDKLRRETKRTRGIRSLDCYELLLGKEAKL